MFSLHPARHTHQMLDALFGRNIAVDLGTATTRIAADDRGRFVEGPSVYDAMPALAHGVVVNPDATARLLHALLGRTRRFVRWRPRVLACVPTDVTPDERAALVGALRVAGASAITVAPEPLAAAIGAGLDVSSHFAQMVVDIGHGVTDCAVIRSGQVVATRAVRRACSDLYVAVEEAAMARHGMLLLPGEAQRLVAKIGVAGDVGRGEIEALGRCVDDDHIRRLAIPVGDVRQALEPGIGSMLDTIRGLLRDLPEGLGAEIIENGMLLSGGGALLPGMTARIEAATGITVQRAPDPLHAVIIGARAILPTVVENDLWQR